MKNQNGTSYVLDSAGNNADEKGTGGITPLLADTGWRNLDAQPFGVTHLPRVSRSYPKGPRGKHINISKFTGDSVTESLFVSNSESGITKELASDDLKRIAGPRDGLEDLLVCDTRTMELSAGLPSATSTPRKHPLGPTSELGRWNCFDSVDLVLGSSVVRRDPNFDFAAMGKDQNVTIPRSPMASRQVAVLGRMLHTKVFKF